MLAVGPLGPQYSLLFALHELGRHAHLGVDTLPSQRVPQKILKKKYLTTDRNQLLEVRPARHGLGVQRVATPTPQTQQNTTHISL